LYLINAAENTSVSLTQAVQVQVHQVQERHHSRTKHSNTRAHQAQHNRTAPGFKQNRRITTVLQPPVLQQYKQNRQRTAAHRRTVPTVLKHFGYKEHTTAVLKHSRCSIAQELEQMGRFRPTGGLH
jgi:hypothetical protein